MNNNKPAKVLISTNILWGIVKFRFELVKHLLNEGHEIVLVGSTDDFSANTIDIIEEHSIKFYNAPLSRGSINPISDLRYLLFLFLLFKKERPGVVLAFTVKPNIYGAIVARFFKIPFIGTITGLGTAILAQNLTTIIIKMLYKFSFIRVNHVLFQNMADRKLFVDSNITRHEKSKYVPGSGINPSFFDLPVKTPTSNLSFMFIGRIIRDKGIYELIESAKKIINNPLQDSPTFYLAGFVDTDNPSGISLLDIRDWEKAGIIKYLDKTDDVMKYLEIADVLVLPSYREGLSRILLEAACCRRPIVCTNVPGCRDIVQDGVNGYLCEPGDAMSLHRALVKMMGLDSEKLRVMGENGRRIVSQHFDYNLVNSIYCEYIQKSLVKNTPKIADDYIE